MRINFAGKSMVDQSIELMRHEERRCEDAGYWLAFSGGKDSIVLHRLAEMAGVKFDAHYGLTTIDPPELVQFIRREYPGVGWERPEHTFCWWLVRKGFPTRTRRWCCEKFKERGGKGRVVLTGIRAQESPNRARRGSVEQCLRHPDKFYVNPILHWRTGEIWEFIRSEGLLYPALYDEGWRRLGCVCCPFESRVRRSQNRWPRIWANVGRAFARGWEQDTPPWPLIRKRFASAETCFEWWCRGNASYPDLLGEEGDQRALFV